MATGSWAQAVKENPPKGNVEETTRGRKPKVVVVDTNAIIKGFRLDAIGDEAVTIQLVVDEVRDKKSREWLARLPFGLTVREPDSDSLRFVSKFAQATGDLHSLSLADLKLLALSYSLEKAAHGDEHLRKHPQQIRILNTQKTHQKMNMPGWGTVPNPEDWAVLDRLEQQEQIEHENEGCGNGNFQDSEGYDGWPGKHPEEQESAIEDSILDALQKLDFRVENVQRELVELAQWPSGCLEEDTDHSYVGPTTQMDHVLSGDQSCSCQILPHALEGGEASDGTNDENCEPACQSKEKDGDSQPRSNGVGVSEVTGDEQHGNLDERPVLEGATTSEFESSVGCVTSDYCMQNVLVQIGLRLVTPDGQRITQLRRWAFRCSACFLVTKETGKIFCPKCGNATLERVEIMVGPEGREVFGVRRFHRLRGSKYSLPLPKGGKNSRDPILSEDVLMARVGQRKGRNSGTNPSPENDFGQDAWVKMATAKKNMNDLLPNQRRNPNERKRGRSNRRKR